MRIPRIYQPIKLFSGLEFTLSNSAANHLLNVLRLSIGSTLRVFNGEGGEFMGVLRAVTKHQAIICLNEFIPNNVESPLAIHLGQGISRGEKMDYTIQKAVELGITQFTPLLTERCGVKLTSDRWAKRLQHWQGVAIAACEQSGRNKLPLITEPQTLMSWLQHSHSGWKLILHPHTGQTLKKLSGKPEAISLLIGPEGGFSEIEIELAKHEGFVNLQLGPRILRTETAGIAAITALQCYFGDMG